MEEKRIAERKKMTITTIIRKKMADGGYQIMEFLSSNLSHGGVFILVEDLAVFDLGDEVEVMVDIKDDRYYEGSAKIVRSTRIFSEEQADTLSGYGLMFLEPDDEFKNMLIKKLDA